MRVTVLGVGAVGGWLAAGLARAGVEVALCARGATLAALRCDGLVFAEGGRTESFALPASDDPAALPRADILLLGLKGHDVPAARETVAALAGPETIIVPALNGVPWWFTDGIGGPAEGLVLESVDPRGALRGAFPARRIIGCVAHVGSRVEAPGRIRVMKADRILLGSPTGEAAAQAEALASVLRNGGVPAQIVEDIRFEVWAKLWGNMSMNPLSVLSRADLAALLDDPGSRGLVMALMEEMARLGERLRLPPLGDIAARIEVARRLGVFKPSTLQDFEAGRRMELGPIIGAPVELADRLGVDVPVMRGVEGMLRLLAGSSDAPPPRPSPVSTGEGSGSAEEGARTPVPRLRGSEGPAPQAREGGGAHARGPFKTAHMLHAIQHAAAALGIETHALLGGAAAAPVALATDAPITPDPLAACRDPATTLVVADPAAPDLLATAALARVMDVTLALCPRTETDASLAAALGAAVALPPGVAAPAIVTRGPPLALREVVLHRIALPLRDLYVSAMYITDRQARTLVEFRCADGTVGWGETLGTPDVVARVSALAKDWLGADLLRDKAVLRRKFARIAFENRHGRTGIAAFAGLDLAAWDASARHLGVPFGALLGDSRADRAVRIACPLPAAVPGGKVTRAELATHMADTRNAARVAELAARLAAEHGITAFKYKSAGTGAAWDLATLGALRECLGPEARLRCDPNAAYSTEEALRLCQATEHLGLEFHEDPTDGLEGMARLGTRIVTPLATNMCVIAPDHLAAAYRRGLRITVLGDLTYWGSVAAIRDMALAARALGLTPALHSFYESGIVTAANIHMARAFGLDDPHPVDCGWPGLREDVVAPDAFRVEGGVIHAPAGPGLGLAPDPARIAALAAAEPVVIR